MAQSKVTVKKIEVLEETDNLAIIARDFKVDFQ